MKSRERVERVINFEEPDRLPYNFWMDRRRMLELDLKYGRDFRVTHFDVDLIHVYDPIPFPSGRIEEKLGTPWMVEPLFKDWRETSKIKLKHPDYQAMVLNVKDTINKNPDKAVTACIANVLTEIEKMICQEDFYMDLTSKPELIDKFFHKLSDIMAELAEHYCRLDITALYVMDDIASSKSLMISPDMFRNHILPHWKKVIDVAHMNNKPVFFHTDGKIEKLYDVFADELKVRMLHPMQPELQDLGEFAKKYKGRTGIEGGLYTGRFHMMTPDNIRSHVFDLFKRAGKGGGLIVSSHDLDISTTEEQLDALALAVRECVY